MTILANRCLDIVVDFGLLGTLWRCFMLRSEFSKGCTKAKTTSSMMHFRINHSKTGPPLKISRTPGQSISDIMAGNNSEPLTDELFSSNVAFFRENVDNMFVLLMGTIICFLQVIPPPFLSYPLLVSFRLDLACWRLALSVRRTQQIFW